MSRRVVVTGMGGVTSLGSDWPTIKTKIAAGETGIRRIDEWDRHESIHTRLGGPVIDFSVEQRYPRKALRSMGPVSRMAVFAAEAALADAKLLDDPVVKRGRLGVAFGSSFGSTKPVIPFVELLTGGASSGITANSYIQMMSHTTAVNIGVFFKLTGRVIPTSSACTSGSQAIGYAYEAIKHGQQDMMIAGGAEELCVSMAAVFDNLYATSTRNDRPSETPRPFDRDRDGLVIGEGAAALLLEERNAALARGAAIHAEIVGFATNSDGNHVTQPAAETMEAAMQNALADAGLAPEAVGYVNGHGTATDWGDVAEATATAAVFGAKTPFSTLKGHFGYTLGACGAIEAWLAIEMMKEGVFVPTANLDNVDPKCAGLDYIVGSARAALADHIMSNNFAFGGINTSLIFRRV